jgi:hypothetical protein
LKITGDLIRLVNSTDNGCYRCCTRPEIEEYRLSSRFERPKLFSPINGLRPLHRLLATLVDVSIKSGKKV